MNNISSVNLYSKFPVTSVKKQSSNNIYQNVHGDVFVRSDLAFKGNVMQKGAEVVTKNKKGFLAAIAAFLGLATASTVKVAPKPVVEKIVAEEKPIVEFKPLSQREYTDVELDAILSWERANNNGEKFTELRDIIKNKAKLKRGDSLKRDEVLLLADFLNEKPEMLKRYLKSHPECSSREILDLHKLNEHAGYYMKVAKYCPYANVDEYKTIADNFTDMWVRERQAVASYSRQRELIQLMQKLQETNLNDYQLKLYFSEYLFTFPQEIREKLRGLSIETMKAQDLPKTSLEELVARLQYLKTPEGKTEHLR